MKDMKCVAAESEDDMMRWYHALRVVKYGDKIPENRASVLLEVRFTLLVTKYWEEGLESLNFWYSIQCITQLFVDHLNFQHLIHRSVNII